MRVVSFRATRKIYFSIHLIMKRFFLNMYNIILKFNIMLISKVIPQTDS